MSDKPINQAPEESTALYSLYARKNNTTNDLIQIPKNQFAHAVGFTASDKGKVPYIDGSGDYANLSIGTSGQLLRASSGGLPEWASVNPSSMSQIEIQTVSSPVSQVVFTDIPSTGYSKFILVGINVVSAVSATTDQILVQTSINNGSTFNTTSGNYYEGTNARTFLARAVVPAATSTFQYGNFVIDIVGLGNASRPTSGMLAGSFAGISTTNASIDIPSLAYTAMRMAAEADNAIRVVTDGGDNIASGTFILYGISEV